MAAELAVPVFAEHALERAPFHADHIVERYGLFTIIVLGEAILSASVSVQEAIAANGLSFEIMAIAISGLVIALAMWWVYFTRPGTPDLSTDGAAFIWGYGHLPVFAGLAAFGAGVQVATDAVEPEPDVASRVGALAVTIPIAVAIVSMLAVAWRTGAPAERRTMPLTAGAVVVVLLLGLLGSVPVAVIGTAAALATLVTVKVVVYGLARPVGVT
jgi:low temperature requirement protein LtrA